jgi:hypothetical protein
MADSLLKAETRHYSAGAADRKGRITGPFPLGFQQLKAG